MQSMHPSPRLFHNPPKSGSSGYILVGHVVFINRIGSCMCAGSMRISWIEESSYCMHPTPSTLESQVGIFSQIRNSRPTDILDLSSQSSNKRSIPPLAFFDILLITLVASLATAGARTPRFESQHLVQCHDIVAQFLNRRQNLLRSSRAYFRSTRESIRSF